MFKGKKEEKRTRKEKCPSCGRMQVVVIDKRRQNYPFGKKSKPIYAIKERRKHCTNRNCNFRSLTKFPPTYIGNEKRR